MPSSACRSHRDWWRRSLSDLAPFDVDESAYTVQRRRVVTAIVVVVGALILGLSMRLEPGSPWFLASTILLAVVWTLGALGSGPLHLGRIGGDERLRRPLVAPVLIGLALAAVFLLGAFAVRAIPLLAGQVETVLRHAERGPGALIVLITVVNGVAEELFFRGAAYASVPRHPVPVTTAAYALATFATGNLMLAFAAIILGIVVGLERRATGGILGPALTHVTWSLAMLFALPLIFR